VPAWTPKHYDGLAARADFIAEVTGLPTRMLPKDRQHEALGSDHYHGGMIAEASGSLHPGKYARGLADAADRAGARLVDGVRVNGIAREGTGFRLTTDRGQMRADAVLVATNGYSRDGEGRSAMPWLARRMIPVGSYIIATEELPGGTMDRLFPGRRMISDTRRVLNYFRPSPYGNRILWGRARQLRPDRPRHRRPGAARLHARRLPRVDGCAPDPCLDRQCRLHLRLPAAYRGAGRHPLRRRLPGIGCRHGDLARPPRRPEDRRRRQ
jgi:glycine/D-amino acid oxidase-like deaminating enzyme